MSRTGLSLVAEEMIKAFTTLYSGPGVPGVPREGAPPTSSVGPEVYVCIGDDGDRYVYVVVMVMGICMYW